MRPTHALRSTAVVLTALALVPAGAHLLELPHKIALPQSAYLIVQGIYQGWWMGGLAWAAALVANALLALALRQAREPWRAAGLAAALLGTAFIVFIAFTAPANRATMNWTMAPPGWEVLRARWEWSHAANAIILFAALCCSAWAAVGRRP